MKMALRWFGTGFDTIPLAYIRQIPGLSGIITTLYDMRPGELWDRGRIRKLKDEAAGHSLQICGIESVNIHESIKAGLPNRDEYIENYIKTLEVLGEEGIGLVCYNFMPVFDWTRSDLAKQRPDGSTVFAYNQEEIDRVNPVNLFSAMDSKSNGFMLPGWEPERMAGIKELFDIYANIDNEQLFRNFKYFLEAIMPVCGKYGIRMAIHPDDPAWPVFGLPRIITSKENLIRMTTMVPHPCNGITLCTGSLGTNPNTDFIDLIGSLHDRIYFAHVRNLYHESAGKFEETSHLSADGSLDMFAIMKALYDNGFDGVMRPDHGRAIWGEISMPGYGLYDRALGIAYLNGIWESLSKLFPR